MENRIKVVLADANENFRTMLQQTIENTGEFDVVGSAGDGAEAWKMIERERPQLVITDVILPELDGFALLDRMAKLPARPKTILVSAFYREQMVMQAMEQGAAYFMAKPCEAGSLLERMRQAVRNGETEEESPVALERLVTSIIRGARRAPRHRDRVGPRRFGNAPALLRLHGVKHQGQAHQFGVHRHDRRPHPPAKQGQDRVKNEKTEPRLRLCFLYWAQRTLSRKLTRRGLSG